MATKNNQSWVLGGFGVFVLAIAGGLVPSLLNAFLPGVLLSAWVAGSGLALAAATWGGTPAPSPAWSASATALALEAPRSLEYWESAEQKGPESVSLSPDEVSFDEDNWVWAHNGEIVH